MIHVQLALYLDNGGHALELRAEVQPVQDGDGLSGHTLKFG